MHHKQKWFGSLLLKPLSAGDSGAELVEQHGLEDMNRRRCCSLSERKQVWWKAQNLCFTARGIIFSYSERRSVGPSLRSAPLFHSHASWHTCT